ncbi:MAG: type II secretion system F family protein [Acidobacteria bacterium]|nr:type II secretion system F family protein [Acidobacteriota bacterium]
MQYRCRLGTPSGEVIESVYVADSEASLRHELEEKGLYVLSISRRGLLPLSVAGLPHRRRIPQREFLVFNQELATLLKAGMPLVQSLQILRQRAANPLFKTVLDDVHDRVRSGVALSEAFGAQNDLFPGVYIASLLAGEKAGNLEPMIRRYVTYAKVIGDVKRKTLSALVYPAVLLAMSFIVVTIIVVKVVPEFAEFYKSFGATLPPITRMIVQVSGFISDFFSLLILIAIAIGAGLWTWVQRPERKAWLDRLVLAIPLLGSTARKLATSQLARTLATLLSGGIPLVNALDVAARSIGNRYLAQELATVGQRVREGESPSAAIAARGVFPDVAIKMVEVGEATGALPDMLNAVADFYDEEIETTLGRFVTLVEPILLAVMGLVIASLLLALYMPLFQLSSVLGG